jgi:hypothetical protein
MYRGRGAAGEHIVYLSPVASATARSMLKDISAVAMADAPDLTGFVEVTI